MDNFPEDNSNGSVGSCPKTTTVSKVHIVFRPGPRKGSAIEERERERERVSNIVLGKWIQARIFANKEYM